MLRSRLVDGVIGPLACRFPCGERELASAVGSEYNGDLVLIGRVECNLRCCSGPNATPMLLMAAGEAKYGEEAW